MNLVLIPGKSGAVLKVFIGRPYSRDQEVVQNDCHEVNIQHENKPDFEVGLPAIVLCRAFESGGLEVSDAASEHVDVVGGINAYPV